MSKAQAAPDRCPLCAGRTGPGETVSAVELGFGVVVVRHVPAMVCETCGESWIEDGAAAKLEGMVDRARSQRRRVEVLAYSE